MKKIRQIIQHYDAKALGVQRGYAVLLPLIKIKDEWHVLYEVRSKHISQPGETSFPGDALKRMNHLKKLLFVKRWRS